MRRWVCALIACSSFLARGSSTLATFGSRGSSSAYNQAASAPYSGRVLDCECNKFGNLPPSTDHCRGDKFIPRIYSGFFWDMSLASRADKYSILALLDAPFSAVGDTLILPATLIQQVAIGNICDGNSGRKEIGAQARGDRRLEALSASRFPRWLSHSGAPELRRWWANSSTSSSVRWAN